MANGVISHIRCISFERELIKFCQYANREIVIVLYVIIICGLSLIFKRVSNMNQMILCTRIWKVMMQL